MWRPLRLLRIWVRPFRYLSTSLRRPFGNASHSTSTADLTGGSASGRCGQFGMPRMFGFQALAKSRLKAGSAALLHRLRYSTNLSTTVSSTCCGEILLAEQYRMKDESRDRMRLSLTWARRSSHSAVSGAPNSGIPFSWERYSKARLVLLRWFITVFGVSPDGTWCHLARSFRTAL